MHKLEPMTDTITDTATNLLAEGVELTVRESVPSSFAPIYNLLISAVRSIPTYNDTQKGRRNSTQIKFALIIIGICCIAFGKSLFWVIVGCLLTLVALIAPIESSRRTSLISNLKRRSRTEKLSRHTVNLKRKKNKIIVQEGPIELSFSTKKKPRHVRKNESSFIGYRSNSGDRIWLKTDLPGGDTPEKNERFEFVIAVDPSAVAEIRGG